MSSSKQPSVTTQTVKNELPSWAAPTSQALLATGTQVANRPYEQYTGERIASLSPEQQMGIYGTMNRALYGNEAQNAGQGMLRDTLSGNYLNPASNPYFKGTVDAAMGQAQGMINSQFNRPGAFGSSAHEGVMSNSLGGIANQMYSNNYQNERANQMGAANQALAYGAADYNDMNAMLGVGDTTRQYQQDLLGQQYADWLEQRNYPLQQLDIMGNALNMAVGNQGSTLSTAPNPYQSNTAANVLGAGLAGYGLLNS